jgi:hypothetical protein
MAAGDEFARIGQPGAPFFQLRSGEEGISVFDAEAVDPPLSDEEILAAFRAGSTIVIRSKETIIAAGLEVIAIAGADVLPIRLQQAHAEIRPGRGMTRKQFKDALRSLE